MTAGTMDSDLMRANALTWMGVNRMKAGKRTEAWEMLYAASHAAQSVVVVAGRGVGDGGLTPTRDAQANTLCYIAREQAKAGDLTEALRTANVIPAGQALDDARAGMAPAQAEAGDLKGALETVARIRYETAKADALGDLAQLLAREGREKEALALASEQKSPAVKARTLLGVIMGKANAKLLKPEAPK